MPDGTANEFLFRPAIRENTPMVMAIAGASGSGKTFTALELAMGLAGDGKVLVVDTEGRRALHYADLRDQHTGETMFRFDHCELRPPFTPERFLAVMKQAEAAGYRVIVIDSFSDEHEGEGGLIDMAAGGGSTNAAANWARPKAAHKLIVRWLRQTRCHVLFCLRAEERVRLEKDDRGKTIVIPIGWWPITEKRFMYDMTASFLLSPDTPGIPEPIKLQEQHRRFFPKGAVVTRESGRQLAAWATGGAPATPPSRILADDARDAALKGKAALSSLWARLNRVQRGEIGHLIGTRDEPGELTLLAKRVDEQPEPPDEIPFYPSPGGHAEDKGLPPLTEQPSPHDAAERAPSAAAPSRLDGRGPEPSTPEEPADLLGDRDPAFWNRRDGKRVIDARDRAAFMAEVQQRLGECRSWAETEDIERHNAAAIRGLDAGLRTKVAELLAARREQVRGEKSADA
jgi:hypothetical protein